jgi:cytochrome c5
MQPSRFPLGSSLLGATLVLAAVVFAWARSTTPGGGPPARQPEPQAQATATATAELGAEVWAARCASCHREGEARGRSIPSLHGFAVDLLVAEGGREYLVDFLFDGRVRQVSNREVSYVKSHPEYDALSDAEAAAVLNHMLTSWGNVELLPEEEPPYTADEIAARR